MPWPGPTEFSQAIQNPKSCFSDPELAQGRVDVFPTTSRRAGLPVLASGNFASVYKVTSGNREFAVRCFLRNVQGQQHLYTQLSHHLAGFFLPTFVEFEYLEHGIRAGNAWYPVVKMEWAAGKTLDDFVNERYQDAKQLHFLAAQWRGVVGSLRGVNMSHGDLQHGNVVVDGSGMMRLVDYDCMFIPGFQGESSPELGHSNYQHPKRSAKDYNEGTDNFSALVIYLSFLAIASEPKLWTSFYNSDNLLFTKQDYSDPTSSSCFHQLKRSSDPTVARLATYLEECCFRPTGEIPALETIIKDTNVNPPVIRSLPAGQRALKPRTGVVQPPIRRAGVSAPISAIVNVPQATSTYGILCPRCSQPNDNRFIYCVNTGCLAVLDPNRKVCLLCQSSIPDNALFCPECGQMQ